MERKEQRLINKIFKLLILFITLFIIFGNINCMAVSLSDMKEKAIDGCFGDGSKDNAITKEEAISTLPFRQFGEPPEYSMFERVVMSCYPSLFIVCGFLIFIVIVLIIVDLIEKKIKKKKVIINKTFLFVILLIIIFEIAAFLNILMFRNYVGKFDYNDPNYSYNILCMCVQFFFVIYMTYMLFFTIVEFIKKIINKDKKINWSFIILFLISFIILCINRCFIKL